MKIIAPNGGEPAYGHAVLIFKTLYEQVTGESLEVCYEDDGKDAVIIGSDAVNDALTDKMIYGKVAPLGIRYGTDDYVIRSLMEGGRRLLILAGGRGRSTIYAVYDFLERVAGCHYFWDGDIIPKTKIVLDDMEIVERPRFEYRGLRYFAHRGLARFQAEHWGYEDWKRELDWMSKKRLNFFMLRIGMDDLWQRAFPQSCDYQTDEAGKGYNDRTPFWSLKYRGRLRQKVLAYAHKLDLIHPEDCGTMSHWYSPAPEKFISNEKPDFFPQADSRHSKPRTLVWDIRKRRNLDNYMNLTETAVREYNPDCAYFHTIGLGERNMMADKENNHRLKKYTYHRIAQGLRERYPASKLFVAAWDFVGWWRDKDVKELLDEFDPERTVILDYTGEADDEAETFVNWGMVGKFPWIFGLFHGYQPESSLRGPYARSDKRLKVAAEDPYCKGMVLWPELSHSDPLILEYLAQNSWAPLEMNINELTERFCHQRYGERAEQMNALWQTALPMIQVGDWGGFTRRNANDPEAVKYTSTHHVHHEMWTNVLHSFIGAYQKPYETADFTHKNEQGVSLHDHFAYKLKTHNSELLGAPDVLRLAAKEWCKDKFIARDVMDIARTALGRYMNFILMDIVISADKDSKKTDDLAVKFIKLLDIMSELLYLHKDYSLLYSLQRLKQEHPVSDGFETTLKRNVTCNYCRSYIAECCRHLYRREAKIALDWITLPKEERPETDFRTLKYKLVEEFIDTPLAQMQYTPEHTFSQLVSMAADIMES